tara:strand:- start:11430 stop:11681 length:252 start_codon:yes stop_codon:yes gene_type:complete
MREPLIDFEKEFKNYEKWDANTSPKEIRKLIGKKLIYVDYVEPYRGTFFIRYATIADAHRSFIIFEDGNNVDKRCIKAAGILK